MSTPSDRPSREAPGTRNIDLQRAARYVLHSCLAIVLLLVVFDYVFNYLDVFDDLGFRRTWNIAKENSIPTWFSSILAHALAVTVFAITAVLSPVLTRWKKAAWLLIGLFFLWVGIDDFAAIHEKLGGFLERAVGATVNETLAETLLWNPSFAWHTFIAPVFAAIGLFILGFLWVSFRREGLLPFLLAGFACWAVAQGIDFIEGLDSVEDIYTWLVDTFSIERRYLVTHTFKVIEEVLEMIGTILLLTGFIRYLACVSEGTRLGFRSTREGS